VISEVAFVFCSFNDAVSTAERDDKEIVHVSEFTIADERSGSELITCRVTRICDMLLGGIEKTRSFRI
jgi:hypothetical protein